MVSYSFGSDQIKHIMCLNLRYKIRLKVCQTNLTNAIGFQQPLQCNHLVQISRELQQVLKQIHRFGEARDSSNSKTSHRAMADECINYRMVSHLKSYCMVRNINSFGPKNAGNIQYISSSSSIHSNLYQHQFSFSKWQMGKILNLK